jgi:hypothetical protein
VPRIRTRYIDLTATFPKDDPLARLMMRAVVLWSDARFELIGLRHDERESDGLATLDKISTAYRRLFFFRASVRTLYSVLKLITALERQPVFRGWLAAPGYERWTAMWNEYRDKIRKMQSTIEADRNRVAAHAEESLEDVVDVFEAGSLLGVQYDEGWGLMTDLGTVVILCRLLGSAETEAALAEKVKTKFGAYADLLGPSMNLLGVACALYSKWRADFFAPHW